MKQSRRRASALALACGLLAAPAYARGGGPRITAQAKDVGSTASTAVLPIKVWLNTRNTDGLEALATELHDKTSPSFGHWLTPANIDAAYAPSAADVATVKTYLASRGLSVTEVGPHNLYISARGTASQLQSAFSVSLHDFELDGRKFSANTGRPNLPSGVASRVARISLNTHELSPLVRRGGAGVGRAPRAADVASAAAPITTLNSNNCFHGTGTYKYQDDQGSAVYRGNFYAADPSNDVGNSVLACGYSAKEVQTAYHLDQLYKAGLDGRGQTVVIVDAYGSKTLAKDLAAFDKAMGLPAAQLQVIGTPTSTPYDADENQAGWAYETTLDVEWAHAVAPGAKLVVVVAPDASTDSLMGSVLIGSALPNVASISNSWSQLEDFVTPDEMRTSDTILGLIGLQGEGVMVASGDAGDGAGAALFLRSVGFPASSNFATGIGGVSLALKADKSINFQVAWGNNLTPLQDSFFGGTPLAFYPFGFIGGSGGGLSNFHAKPSFQHAVSGPRRMVPDISWLADSFTGGEVVTSLDASNQALSVVGGTSLATPMFSALWAIAQQKAGHGLGQAARYVYNLDAAAITDIKPFGSASNVTGVITDQLGNYSLPSYTLAAGLNDPTTFYSALTNLDANPSFGPLLGWGASIVTFGTDSSLTVTPGYDTATGVGVPNPVDFVREVSEGK